MMSTCAERSDLGWHLRMVTTMCRKPVAREMIASSVVTAGLAEVGKNVASMTETVQEGVVALDAVEDRKGVQGDGMITAKDNFGVVVEGICAVAVATVFAREEVEKAFVVVDGIAILEVVVKATEEAGVMDFEVVAEVVARNNSLFISSLTLHGPKIMRYKTLKSQYFHQI
jgi:hypothetical protein